MANYTWSQSFDNDSNNASTENYGYDFPENVYDLDAEWAYSRFDVRHRFVFSGTYEMNDLLNLPDWYNLDVSGIFNYQSGKPWSPEYNGDANRDGYTRNDRPRFEDEDGNLYDPGRNSERQPSTKKLDLRITNGFKFRGAELELIFEVFNVMNWDNYYIPYWNFNPSSEEYGEATLPGNPREYQVGMRFKF